MKMAVPGGFWDRENRLVRREVRSGALAFGAFWERLSVYLQRLSGRLPIIPLRLNIEIKVARCLAVSTY